MEHLPKVEVYAACFRLVQVTERDERSFEASHSIVKRKVPPNAAGLVVSLSLRLHDFAQAVKMHKPVLEEVATQFSIARRVKNLPGLVGLHLHPDIVSAQGQSRNKWSIVRQMNKVLYRADVPGELPDVAHMDVSDQRHRDKQQRVTAKHRAENSQ